VLQGMFGSAGQQALEGRLAALIAGQAGLSQSISNIDTPGYTGTADQAFEASLQAALTAQLGGSNPDQTGAGGLVAPVAPAEVAGAGGVLPLSAGSDLAGASSGVVTPDGNGADFNALMVELSQNDLDYQAVTRQLHLVYQNLNVAVSLTPGGGA